MTKYLPILWIIILSVVTIQLEQPISVSPADSSGFSAHNAMKHLNVMASEVHFMGTQENKKVKNYILEEFAKLNIPTEIFIGHSKHSWGNGYIRMGRTENILATIKGSSSEKAVVVVGHYDSVISSPGAADDVHSVACILEVAKLLKKENHKNDIIFLITDGEEMGLLGAKAFTEMRDLSNIGLVLNYEARGNSGPSISFEWSEGNSWLVRQLRKVANRPIANSMSFEIYKNLPNDTDFTYFREAGLTGINNAFIDGFSYYHNPADTPENINQSSVQHAGENMYLLSKHFANTDLTTTRTHNATFFNFISFLIIYPSSWDIFILVILLTFIAYLLIISFKKKIVSLKSFSIAFVLVVLSIVISALISFGLSKILFVLYPQYDVFYAGQFYNHKWYLWTCIGITIIINSLIIKSKYLREHPNSIKSSALLLMGLLAVVFYIYITTATYFILYPTLALGIFYFISVIKDEQRNRDILTYATSIVPLAIWLPVVISFFLAFSLVGLPLPTIHICIIILGSMILFNEMWTASKAMEYIGMAVMIISLVMAHLSSAPTEKHPLPSSLFYNYNVTTQQGKWATEDDQINIGNKALLEGATHSEMKLPHTRSYWNVNTDIQPSIPIPKIVTDTLFNNSIKVISNQEIYLTRLFFKETSNIDALYINNQEVFAGRKTEESLTVDAYAMIADSLQIRITKKDEHIPQIMGINSNHRVLPIKDELPSNALRVDGFTDIVQEISF